MPERSSTLQFHRDRCASRLSHPVLRIALEATAQGAQRLVEAFQTEVDITVKGTANFVSSADLAAEQAIVSAIREQFPDHAIISEETHRDRADAESLWVIDPLDGTSNFLHGIPHFAVSIGYYEKGRGTIGVVCNPITSDWYVAVDHQGAWHNGRQMVVSRAERLSQAMIACGFYYDRGRMMEATLAALADLFRAEIHGMRRFGAAALDIANVAGGLYEAFFEYRLSPWDYAAGAILLHEAGGRITDCSGYPLPLGTSSSVCATNGYLHPALLEQLDRHLQHFQSDETH
jgi:myo-inositol-1(or 4)-monophosphatase